ncbi:hypothetical protein K432DRAFT_280264, partial [Lepidopterella palustris CBS 459.81]
DVKPRLTKEQHDILEAHFQQQHKPSTSTKKGFAESLGVPVDKINVSSSRPRFQLNWFQNRRAKVKQDLKKQMSQLNMSMNMGMNIYGTAPVPIINSQFSQNAEPMHPQSTAPDFYSVSADMSPPCLPVESIEGSSAMDPLGSQISLNQGFDMHMLRSIPETERSASYNPNAVMQSFLGAVQGSYMHNTSTSVASQDPSFSYDQNGIPHAYANDASFSLATSLPNDSSHDIFNGLADFSGYDYPTLTTTSTSTSIQAVDSNGSISSEPSPFSGTPSNATTQSSTGPNALSSVTSVASLYSNWTDEHNSSTEITPATQRDDPFDHPHPFGNLPPASASEHGLPLWASGPQNPIGQPFHQADMYQHNNTSAHAIMSSPEQTESRKISASHSDLEPPNAFSEEAFSRRNSSTTALTESMNSVGIQNKQPLTDGFKQPSQPSSIASRRQRRPAALNPTTLRSASYTSGMPTSPGPNQTQAVEHNLRRIRSTGITSSGRIQKPNPGSAQRSPLNFTFDNAASPKFARQTGFATTVGPAGSLAPPTPLTPSEMARFPYWQSSTVIRSHPPMPEHSSPESLNVSWSMEPSSAGMYSNAASPPTTPLDLSQINNARLNNSLYRDTPPQSAPATQQCFPRTAYVMPPQSHSEFHSVNDLPIAQPKPSHFRRPSLPDTGQNLVNDSHMQFPVQLGNVAGDLQISYNYQYKDETMNGFHRNALQNTSHDSLSGQPSVSMPEFFVHEYSPPQAVSQDSLPPRQAETQPKTYIFANHGPHDFR